jgi:hypothetical protein
VEETTKARLAAVLERKRAVENDIAEADAAAAKRKAEHEEAKTQTLQRWQQAFADISKAVAAVNEQCRGHGTHFHLLPIKQRQAPDLFQISIDLRHPDKVVRSVHLSVDELGGTKIVFTMPHTGKGPSNGNIIDTSEDYFANVLTSFLEQVIEHIGKENMRSRPGA